MPETLRAGSKSGGVAQLYDKHAQMNGRVPYGTMRFEVQAHQGWLKSKADITTFGDLTEVNIDKLFFDRMEWFGLEAEVMTFGTFLDRILDDSSLDTRTQNGLLKYVRAIQRGSEPEVSARTAQTYKRLLRERHIAPYDEGAADPSVTRLDFESGTEIQVA
jgi:hypothetical protein